MFGSPGSRARPGAVGVKRLNHGTAASSKSFWRGDGTWSSQEHAKVWVQFSGAGAVSTINSQFNVSSVTRNATGDYTVNFAVTMPDINYSFNCATGPSSAGTALNVVACRNAAAGTFIAPTTTALRVSFYATFGGGTATDPQLATVTIFGN